ncbi:MAG: S-methyl-5-thioribose-1-phosphate isomerase [Chitinivibrionales bacterium]|nr:S-methyl-5-thioribose-1-phosphate isomerase [Chitinivibrionales bacterium]
MPRLKTIEWGDNSVRIIDQTLLPARLSYCKIDSITATYDAIKTLKIRGAPAIGVAGAYGLYLGMADFPEDRSVTDFLIYLDKNVRYLDSSRPTAVNLSWALQRLRTKAKEISAGKTILQIKQALLEEAHAIFEEDRTNCRKIGENGFELIKEYHTILTHCNAGGLATTEYGTALAPLYIGTERGRIFSVYADETRPLLQGARITAFELNEAGIPVTVICDSMAASVIAAGKVDAIIVGADRIAANGDTANKIGTYSLALVAREHKIPFFVAAPLSTFDTAIPSGNDIPIEEREPGEITDGFGKRTVPDGVAVYNPAFDITPYRYISAIITEKGIILPPFETGISRLTAEN